MSADAGSECTSTLKEKHLCRCSAASNSALRVAGQLVISV